MAASSWSRGDIRHATFSSDHYVLITVPIHIHDSDLHPSTGARAVLQNMPLPVHGAIHHDSLVAVDSERLIGARIMIMHIVAELDQWHFPPCFEQE